MRIFNLPPQPRGTEMEQIAALRNYLVQLAQDFNTQSEAVEKLERELNTIKKENTNGN